MASWTQVVTKPVTRTAEGPRSVSRGHCDVVLGQAVSANGRAQQTFITNLIRSRPAMSRDYRTDIWWRPGCCSDVRHGFPQVLCGLSLTTAHPRHRWPRTAPRSGDPSAGPASGSRALHPPWCGVVALLRVSQQAASRRLVPIATPYGVAEAGDVTSLGLETLGVRL